MMLNVLSYSVMLASVLARNSAPTEKSFCHLNNRSHIDRLTSLELKAGSLWSPEKCNFSDDVELLETHHLGELVSQ